MPNVFDDATTSDIIAIVRQWRAGKLPIGSSRQSKQLQPYQPQLPFFTNDSGEAIPPYACMQVTGTLEIGARNYLVVDKPADTDGTAGAFIFNGGREVEADTEGLAQASAVLRGFKDTGTATGGERWSPVSGQWYIEQSDGGQFICCGDDDVDTDVLKVMFVGGTTTRGILRLGFSGRDSANAVKWDDQFTISRGYLHYSTFSDGLNMSAPSVGVTAIADTTSGAPAAAEMLSFASAGDYRLTLQWIVGIGNSDWRPMSTGTTLWDTGAIGIGGELGMRKFSQAASSFLAATSLAQTFIDIRVIRMPTPGNLKVGVSVVAGTGTLPDPFGSLTVEKM